MLKKNKDKSKNKVKFRNDLYRGTRNEENSRGVSMEQYPMHQIGPEE